MCMYGVAGGVVGRSGVAAVISRWQRAARLMERRGACGSQVAGVRVYEKKGVGEWEWLTTNRVAVGVMRCFVACMQKNMHECQCLVRRLTAFM